MLKKLSKGCVNLMQKYLPDPFIFCIVLTIIVFILAMPLTGQGPMAMVRHWGNGVWGLLAFAMQMALVLVLGASFANAPAIKKILSSVAGVPQSPFSAIFIVTIISMVCCWLNWGFGLIVGALLAKEVAKKRNDTDYRLLIASAYTGFVVWHAGFSGSVPLALSGFAPSETVKAAANTGGAVTQAVPASTTIFAPWNILACVLIAVIVAFINAKMHPDAGEAFIVDPALLKDEEVSYKKPETPAEKLENSPILSYIIVIMGVAFLVWRIANKKFTLDLNAVNFIFLLLGIAFNVTPIGYVRAVNEAVKGAGGIILQFPFYAGIQGMMVGATAVAAGGTGLSLAAVISNALVAISTPLTFPLLTFLSAGIVNFFVPSGGGQWSVQGPIIMPAAVARGVPTSLAAMAIAWGDAWTNMVQPFWALPALGVAKLGAKDIMGYCIICLIISGIIVAGCLLLAGMGILMP